jgi:DNA-binding response OmpR family regulator
MKSPSSVLIVEDDSTLRRVVSDNFVNRGYSVVGVEDGNRAIEEAMGRPFDLIILDVMLPLANGYEVCRYLRQEGIETPIIFLTAKGEGSDILLGLGLGGDDYLTKPFNIRVLLARAEAILRRSNEITNEESPEANFTFGRFSLEVGARKLRDQTGQPVKLSPREYDLLEFFLRHRGEALHRDRIMDQVWGHGSQVTLRSVDRFVTALRRILEDTPGEFIETVREFGYRFR